MSSAEPVESRAPASGKRLDHEKMDVYRVALEFAVWWHRLDVPKGNADLVDQLNRASTSVLLNIAEGSGEFSPLDKQRFFRMARRSATECAAALDLLEAVRAKKKSDLEPGRQLIGRVVAMLTKLVPREKR